MMKKNCFDFQNGRSPQILAQIFRMATSLFTQIISASEREYGC